MAEEGRHRLAGVFSVIVCMTMLTGLMMMAPESAKAFPDDAWIVGNVSDGTNPVEYAYVKAMLFMGEGVQINWTTTNVDGDFLMMVPGGLTYVVFAAHSDYYMLMNTVTISPGETKTCDFTLSPLLEVPDVTIHGFVTNESGAPRSDGHVLGMVTDPLGGDMPYYANITTPDPITGYYEVKVIPGPRGGGAVGMDFPDYPMSQNDTTAPLESGMSYEFNITLKPQVFSDDAMVYGYVTNVSSGLPLSSSVISYEVDVGMERYSNWTMTNELGYYAMDVHSGDNLRLTIQKIGYTIKFYEIDVLPTESVQQDAVLRYSDAKIQGYVTEEGTGDPIAFGRVFLVDNVSMQENISMATTDSTGHYELDAFSGTGLYFGAEQDGYARNFTTIDVNPGDVLSYDFTLVPYSSWLVGQVTDALTGAPLMGASVYINGPVEQQQGTNGTGEYNFSLVPGDYYVQVNHWAGGTPYKTYYDNITVPDGVEYVLNVDLVPWRNALVRGHVYDLISNNPVPFANISLEGWWGNNTMADGMGDYELLNVDGNYTIRANADGYEGFSANLSLDELSVTVFDIGMMPMNPATTSLLHGYVRNSSDLTPVIGAEVRIRLDNGTFEKFNMTDSSGYYELNVPPWVLKVRATAYQHAPNFTEIDLTGVPDYSLDIALDWDMYKPNLTHSQSPLENISWSNPSLIQATVEEQNLREMTLMFFRELNSSGLNSNWSLWRYDRTSFDPWNPENNLPFTIVDGNYSVNMMWQTWGLCGLLWNGTEQAYFPASSWMWYPGNPFAVSGEYSNSTISGLQGAGLFNSSTGQFMAFWGYGMMNPIEEFDASSIFSPLAFVLEFREFSPPQINWTTLGAWDVAGLMFTSQTSYPSGNYITEFYTNDWGGQGDAFLNYVTVDNDGPTANAGPDQTVLTVDTVTLDGSGSIDNVGIETYAWQFDNATGVPTTLYGEFVTYQFELPGDYDIDLTVWDGAGHSATDSLVVHVYFDAPPVANAGADQTVDEDTVVTFDGSGSSDDVDVVNYTWTIVELSVTMYEVGPQYTFSVPGTYHVSLIVNDTVGQWSTPDEMVVTVEDATNPVAYAGLDQVVSDGTLVAFDGSGSTDNVGIDSYVWSFFDVMPVELYGDKPSYTFSGLGSYLVTLNVSDAAGNWAIDTMTVDVIADTPPVADAGPDQTVDEGTLVTFDGSNSTDDKGINNYTWEIIELSEFMFEVNPTYTFSEPGIYHVWLVVNDTINQFSDPDEMVVTVNDVTPPDAVAAVDPDQYVNNGTVVTLNGSYSTDNGVIVDYNWTFFDVVDIELHGMTVDYTFSGPGSYEVTLKVTDAGGNWDTDTIWIDVNGPPVADPSDSESFVYVGDSAYFSGWASSDDFDWKGDMSYTWRFVYGGSTVVLTGIEQWYEFYFPGEYTIYLTVVDSLGLEGNSSMVLTVGMYWSAWWVDPVTGETLADGATVSHDYAILRGYVDPDEAVNVITSTEAYQVYADGDGFFEVNPLNLSEGLNIATVYSYNWGWGDILSFYKMISSDTNCLLWVDSPESPTSDLTLAIGGWTDSDADVTVNGIAVAVRPDGTFSTSVALLEGFNVVNITATDSAGNMNWAEFVVERDTTPPSLIVTAPLDGAEVGEPNVLVYGTVDPGAVVRVNGVLAEDGTDWSATVSLVEGSNTIVVTAIDSVGNMATTTLAVDYVPPVYVTPEELAAVRAELLGEINNLSAALQENVSALQDQIDSAMDAIAGLQTSLAENITALQGQIDSAMDEILALQTSLAENITALQAQIDAAMDEIAALQASVAENVTDLQDQIDAAVADIAGLQASLLENVTALQTQITSAMADIVALETALTENVTALQSQISDAVLDISELQAALAENVTALESDIASLEADLQANITALQQAIAQNATALQLAFAQNVTALQAQIASLRSDLQANVTSLTAALAENVTALDGLVDALGQDVADMQDEIASMNATLVAAQDQMETALDSMQADVDDLQQQLNDLNQTLQNDINDVEQKTEDTDSFASMLMYLTLILFAIAIVMVALVWYLSSKKLGKGGSGAASHSLEEVAEPSEVEREFESLEKEIKREEL